MLRRGRALSFRADFVIPIAPLEKLAEPAVRGRVLRVERDARFHHGDALLAVDGRRLVQREAEQKPRVAERRIQPHGLPKFLDRRGVFSEVVLVLVRPFVV